MWTGIRINSPQRRAFEKLLGRIHPGAIVCRLHSTSDTNGAILMNFLRNVKKWDIISTLDDI